MASAAKGAAATDTPPAENDNAERITALDYSTCPKCEIGVLRVTGFDPAAIHEALQGTMAVPFEASGGAAHRHCFLCGYHESEPLHKLEGDEE
ncbi:MAG TPA: hypothetical protein VFS60_00375, partial [Thermoanaerobaculia bacterium]|nr:hypothetical protein [Thermoanaerobaculia bacterium]